MYRLSGSARVGSKTADAVLARRGVGWDHGHDTEQRDLAGVAQVDLSAQSGNELDRGVGTWHGAAHPARRPLAGGLRRASRADRPGHPVRRPRDVRRPPARAGPGGEPLVRLIARATRDRSPTGQSHRSPWSVSSQRSAAAPDGRLVTYGLDDTPRRGRCGRLVVGRPGRQAQQPGCATRASSLDRPS